MHNIHPEIQSVTQICVMIIDLMVTQNLYLAYELIRGRPEGGAVRTIVELVQPWQSDYGTASVPADGTEIGNAAGRANPEQAAWPAVLTRHAVH